jgi:hypothetical protein
MSKTLALSLHHSYHAALAAVADAPKSNKALERLIRVRQVQMRAAKHFRVAVSLTGPR